MERDRDKRALPLVGTATALIAAGACAVLGGLLLLTACASGERARRVTPHDEALRQVHERRGRIGWDGLQVGMTFAEVERALGRRLGVPDGPGPLCGRYVAEVAALDQPLRLSFTGGAQAARLAAITVLLRGGFDAGQVLQALEARLGELTLVPSPHARERGPAEVRRPLYRTAAGAGVFLDPDDGIGLGDVCVD